MFYITIVMFLVITHRRARRFIPAFLLLSITLLQAQQPDLNIQFRLAQGFEQSGEWERALPLYESLHRSDPQNYVFFDGLRRTYTYLKMYDKAVELVERRMQSHPGDPVLQAMLGSLYYQSGDSARANELWHNVIAADSRNVNVYRLVASQMIEHRLYDQAIALYKRSRDATGDQRAFAEELAWLYSSFQQYALATQEFMRLLKANPAQLAYVQGRIGSFSAREEGIKQALDVVRDHVAKDPANPALRTLLAWIHMERKDFRAALEEYRIFDRQAKANGRELFSFAQRALQEQAYDAAAVAFRELIEQHPDRDRMPYALLGLARATEELSQHADTISPPARRPARRGGAETRATIDAALALYEDILDRYAGTDFAAQASFRIGVIRRERLFDLDGALAAFERTRQSATTPNLHFEATMQIAEVHTMRNNLAGSRQEYEKLLPAPMGDFRDRALFRLAELDYFEGNFDEALNRMQGLTANLSTDLANDALVLQYFINENKNLAPSALIEFAKADLLMRQKKHSEALARFESIAQQYFYALLYDDALMKIAEIHLILNDSDKALAAFTKIANDLPTSIVRDRAQFRIGEVYETVLNNTPLAIEAYERILTEYPHSLYTEEARKRIRMLRGDAI